MRAMCLALDSGRFELICGVGHQGDAINMRETSGRLGMSANMLIIMYNNAMGEYLAYGS